MTLSDVILFSQSLLYGLLQLFASITQISCTLINYPIACLYGHTESIGVVMVCTNKDTFTAGGYNSTEHSPDTSHSTGGTVNTESAARVLQTRMG